MVSTSFIYAPVVVCGGVAPNQEANKKGGGIFAFVAWLLPRKKKACSCSLTSLLVGRCALLLRALFRLWWLATDYYHHYY
jgi:hypothetical protein